MGIVKSYIRKPAKAKIAQKPPKVSPGSGSLAAPKIPKLKVKGFKCGGSVK